MILNSCSWQMKKTKKKQKERLSGEYIHRAKVILQAW